MKTAFLYSFIICCFVSVSAFAQGEDLFKDLLKESLKESIKTSIQNDMKTDPLYENLFPDSTWKTIEPNVHKPIMPRLGFNHRLNLLILNYKDSLPLGPEYTMSPYLMAAYSNWVEYDRTSTETGGDILANVFLRPIASIIMVNPIGVFLYLMDVGILPNDPLPTRQSKHEKAVRYITKEIYPNGD